MNGLEKILLLNIADFAALDGFKLGLLLVLGGDA